MNAGKKIFPLALCFVCISLNHGFYSEDLCETEADLSYCLIQSLTAPFGSSVLLPCTFLQDSTKLVSWGQIHDTDLVNLTHDGRVTFLDPRRGRVKAFPNLGSIGNYSIRIDELRESDLGCYRCNRERDCQLVKIIAEKDPIGGETLFLVYVGIGIAASILLTVGCYFCVRGTLCRINKGTTQYSPNNPPHTGASAPPLEAGQVSVATVAVAVQQWGQEILVYENDDPSAANQQARHSASHLPNPDLPQQATQSTSGIYPNLEEFNRMQSQRKKERFHTEFFRRLREASVRRHHYVNQSELRQQQAAATQPRTHRRDMRPREVQQNCEYKNPIYNRSTEQLNHQ